MKKMYVLATALALLKSTSAFSQETWFSPSDQKLTDYGDPEGATPGELTLLRETQYYYYLCRGEGNPPLEVAERACILNEEYRKKIADKWYFDKDKQEWTRRDRGVCH